MLDEVLQYAYENDLIRDYRLNSFSLSHLFGRLLQSTVPATAEHGLTDCSHLEDLELPNPTPCAEKLSVTDAALALICEARRGLTEEEAKSLSQEVCDVKVRSLKLEMPILRTDNDRDVREFRNEHLARQDVYKTDHRIPFDPIDVEAGEGLELPAKVRLEAEAFLKRLEAERLEVTRESTKYLAGSLRAEFNEEDRRGFVLEETRNLKYEKVSVRGKLCCLSRLT